MISDSEEVLKVRPYVAKSNHTTKPMATRSCQAIHYFSWETLCVEESSRVGARSVATCRQIMNKVILLGEMS
jgi:hypothetical protein